MTRLAMPGLAGTCPACDAAPLARRLASRDAQDDLRPRDHEARIVLSLPGAHCALCITQVEAALMAVPGVRAARVNLTLRRVTIDAPGLSPLRLIHALDQAGHEALELDPDALTQGASDPVGRDLLMRIGIAGFAMMNVMILSVAVWSGADAATRDLFHWISGAIALPTVAFAGFPFFASAWRALRAGRLGMDMPISLALVLASAISLFETTQSGHHAYFDAAVMLCFFLLIGRYLDHRTRAIARSAAAELTALEVPRAILLSGIVERVVPVAQLRPGDMIRLRPGSRIPADGIVTEGTSEIDRALLTGETLPVPARPGMALSAGEVNLTGPLVLRVTAAGQDSSLARLTALVEAAETARGRYTSLADRAARAYSPAVHAMAAASLAGWFWATGDLRLAVNVAAAVLIITCPCALGLAVPAVVTAASGRLFRRGLLIKDGTALERLAQTDTVVLDKTGTLTMGAPRLVDPDAIPEALRPVALTLAQGSAHPLARALAEALGGTTPAALSGLQEYPGLGIEGRAPEGPARLGRAEWAGQGQQDDGVGLSAWLSVAGHAPLRLAFRDRLRPGAAECVTRLQRDGMRVILLSGDRAAPVRELAEQLGIAEWHAGIDPAGKQAMIAALSGEGARVLMVGDGLNDTAALAQAHASISPASALDAARVASDMVLTGQDLAPVALALRIARQSTRRIRENFAISFGYNVVAVPIALMGLATPLLAALAMSISSITVTLNALRLGQGARRW